MSGGDGKQPLSLPLQQWGLEKDLGNQTTGLNPDSELECCYHGNCEGLSESFLAWGWDQYTDK